MYLLAVGMFLILAACSGACADGCVKACCSTVAIEACADDCAKACCKGCHATEGDNPCLADHSCCATHHESDPEEDAE